MIAIRTKNLSPLFLDVLDFKKFMESNTGIDIVISPSDGVDWNLSGFIPKDTTIYSLIPHIDRADETIESQKLALGLDISNNFIPLFDAELIDNFEVLKKFPGCGLYNVESQFTIQKFEEDTEFTPSVIRIAINPLNYPKEILDYCKEEEISIIATEIFGNDLMKDYMLSLFNEPFLHLFAKHNSNIVEIPSSDPYLVSRFNTRVFNEKEEQAKLLEYSKDLNLYPSLFITAPKKRIYQYFSINIPDVGSITLEGNRGSFYLKQQEERINLGEALWEDSFMPEDINSNDKELLGTLHRYHVLPELEELHPKFWKFEFKKIVPDFWLIKVIPRSILSIYWKEIIYWYIHGKLYKMPSGKHEFLIND